MTFKSWAQNFEDVMLWRALRHVKQGFWVDVGAADPKLYSVTYAFSEAGWTGINIEPAERPFKLLCRDRTADINLQVAAGEVPGTIQLHIVGDANGLTTTDAALAAQHAQSGYSVTVCEVPVRTLADICAQYAADTIHFMKIDVEGAETSVIRGADFKRFRPWILLVEANKPGSDLQAHADWEKLIESEDYRQVYFDGLNKFYIADEKLPELSGYFQSPPNVFDAFVRGVDTEAAEDALKAEASAKRLAATYAEAAEMAINRANAAEAAAAAEHRAAEKSLAAMEERLAFVQDQMLLLQKKLALAEQNVLALTNSSSWKITGPMRSIVYRSRRLLQNRSFGLVRRKIGFSVPKLPENTQNQNEAAIVGSSGSDVKTYRMLDDEALMELRTFAALSAGEPAAVRAATDGDDHDQVAQERF